MVWVGVRLVRSERIVLLDGNRPYVPAVETPSHGRAFAAFELLALQCFLRLVKVSH